MGTDTGPAGLGQAVYLGSSSSALYIEVNGKSDPGNNPLSMAAWFKTTNSSDVLTVIHGKGDQSSDVAVLTIVDGQPAVGLTEAGSYPSYNGLVHNSTLDGQWHHIAMTWTGGSDDTLRLFVDGKPSALRTQEAGYFDISGWRVGAEYGGTNYFDGSLDDVRMYSRELSGGDIAKLYALGIPEPGTLALLVTGSVALLLLRRRRRR